VLTRPTGLLQQLLQLGDPLIALCESTVTISDHLIAFRQRPLQPRHHRLQAGHNPSQVCFGIASRTRNGRLRSLGSARGTTLPDQLTPVEDPLSDDC
jgi:hypothetical protein